MCLDTIFTTDLLKASPSPWVYGITICPMLGFPWGSSFCTTAGVVGALYWVVFLDVFIVANVLSVAVNILILNPMYGPPWVFAPSQSLP